METRTQRLRRLALGFSQLLQLVALAVKAYELLLTMESTELPRKRRYRRAFRENPDLPYKRLRNLSSKEFQKLYRIKKSRFNQIFEDLGWQRGVCAAKKKGHYAEVRLAASIRHFSMGVPSRALTDVYAMGEATLRFQFEQFTDKFIKLYEKDYLKFDLREVVRVNEEIHGSLACWGPWTVLI